MKSVSCAVAWILGAAVVASAPHAAVSAPESYGVAVRDWRASATTLSAKLTFDLPERERSERPSGTTLQRPRSQATPAAGPASPGLPGRAGPASRDGWLPGDLVVNVSIVLDGECPLRIGEQETFSVEGVYQNNASLPHGSNSVLVRLSPSAVAHAYQDLEGPMPWQRVAQVWGASGTYDVSFRLTPRGRVPIVPPNTISEILLEGPPAGSSLKMTWKDAGNTESVKTAFLYEVWEKRWWWRDILIARGESPMDTAAMVSVSLAEGSPELAQPGQLFRHDHHYELRLALRRSGSDYRVAPSPVFKTIFRYREIPSGFAERIVTPLGHVLDGAGGATGRESSRDMLRFTRFDRLVE
jgi:hypothetical protein